mmetsp:Transcript_17451/g.32939  ORF Transcript_17451/g.32939 Transcript_17451/m.32939 type:complete len:1239 (+) Transcript_17451:1-3717(+)
MVIVEAELAGARESELTRCAETAAGSGEAPPPESVRALLRATARAGEMACAVDKRAITLPLEGMEVAETEAKAENAWVAAVAEAEKEAEAEELCVSLSAAAEAAVAEALILEAEGTEGAVDVSWVLDIAENETDQQASGSMDLSRQIKKEVPSLENAQHEADVESKAGSEEEFAAFERACSSDSRRDSDAKSSASILEAAMAVASEAGDLADAVQDLADAVQEEIRENASDSQSSSGTAAETACSEVMGTDERASEASQKDLVPDVDAGAKSTENVLQKQETERGDACKDLPEHTAEREHAPINNEARFGVSSVESQHDVQLPSLEDAARCSASHVESQYEAQPASLNEGASHSGSHIESKHDVLEQREDMTRKALSDDVTLTGTSTAEVIEAAEKQQASATSLLRRLEAQEQHEDNMPSKALPDNVMLNCTSAAEMNENADIQQEQDDMWTWMYGCGYVPDQLEGLHSGVPAQAQVAESQELLSRQRLWDDGAAASPTRSLPLDIGAKQSALDSPEVKAAEQKLSSLLAVHEAQAELLAKVETHAQNTASAAETLKKRCHEEHARAEHAEVASQAGVTVREELRAHLEEERAKRNRWEALARHHEDGTKSQRALVEQANQRLAKAEKHAEHLESWAVKESSARQQERDLAEQVVSQSRQAAAEAQSLVEEELRGAAEHQRASLAEQELREAAEQQKALASLEELCARYSLGEQQAKDEAARLSQELLKREQEDSVRHAQSSQSLRSRRFQFCPGVGARRSGQREEARELCAEFEAWTAQAEQRAQEAAQQSAGAEAEAAELEAIRHRLHEEEEMLARDAFHAAQARLQEDQQAEEALSRREVAEAEHHHEEEAAEQQRARMEARERCLIDEGDGSRVFGLLVPDVPLAVRIPSFDAAPRIGGSANYNIIVEGPGATETLLRCYSDFRELHDTLSAKPFASSLQALPQDWIFASFSTRMLERRRRHLEAYLAFLCTHAQVLLDSALWNWLGVDDLTQVVVRLVAARTVQWAAELSRLVETLEAVLAAGGDANRCVHPAVLGVLQEVLMDFDDEAAQAAACRVLERLLVNSTRARQLFLASPHISSPRNGEVLDQPGAAGAAALAAVCLNSSTGGPRTAAVETMQHVLEALNTAVADAEARQSAAAAEAEVAEAEVAAATAEGEAAGERRSEERSAAAAREADDEPGECCVCLDRGKSHALLPCGHLCTCMDCADYLAARGAPCPVCRRTIEQAVQIFI